MPDRCRAANVSASSAGDCCPLRAVSKVAGVPLCRRHAQTARLALFDAALEKIAALATRLTDDDVERDTPLVEAVGTALLALEDGGVDPPVNPQARRITAAARR